METVTIFDTTLRDGEQSPGAAMTAAARRRIAGMLDDARVDVIEAGFPASSPLSASSVATIARRTRNATVAALARAVAGDIDAAYDAVRHAPAARIHVFVATSAIHLEKKLRMTPEAALEAAVDAVRAARRKTRDVEFSAEDATRSDAAYLERVCAAVIAAGATTINLPDTVGYALPHEYGALFARMRANVPGAERVTWSAHTHDDLGLAAANALAAVANGARQIECTINGIGERAGNCALEEVVMALRVRGDELPYATRFESVRLAELSKVVARATRMSVQKNKAIVGANAFAHQSGIHQDGILKERRTYEIIDPASVGASTALPLNRLSGRHALFTRAQRLGLAFTPGERIVFERRFRALADRVRDVGDRELRALHAEVMREAFDAAVAV